MDTSDGGAASAPLPDDDKAWGAAVLAAIGEAGVICDAHGHVVRTNAAAERMAAQGDATWRRLPLPAGWEVDPPEDDASNDAFPTERVLADGQARRGVRVNATRPNGKRVALDVTVVPIPEGADGPPAGAATLMVDVTRRAQLESELHAQRQGSDAALARQAEELAQAQRMLERSKRFADAVADAMPAQVAYWENGTVCRFANGAFLAWAGRASEGALGHTRLELQGAAHESAVDDRVRDAMAGRASRMAVALRSADGRIAPFDVHFVPARGRGGAVHGVYTIAFDRSELRAVQARLERTQAAFDALREPVASVQGLARELREAARDAAGAARAEALEAAAQRMTQAFGEADGEPR